MENSNLVKLIKSLEKNEKRHVSMQLSKHKSTNNLLRLYSVISEIEPVNDEIIAKKIPDKKFISQLKINKHNLYYLILDALHNFHLRGSEYGRILNFLHQAEILSAKGLTIARRELLLKAGKIADQYALSELKLEILRLQNLEPDNMTSSTNIHNETKKLAERVQEESKIKHLNNRMSVYQRKVGQRLTKTQLKYLEKQMLNTINVQNFKGHTFFNQFFYFRMLSLYHTMAGRTIEAHENNMRLLNLFKEEPHMTNMQIWKDRYLSVLSRLITSSSLIGKNEMIPFLAEEIKKLDISDKRKAFADINILDAYMQLGEFEISETLVKQVENNTEFYHKSLGPANRTALYFNLAVLNFGLENYSRSLSWINAIINNPDNKSENVGVANTIRIMRLLLYYELGYHDIMEYELRSTYRYISKQKDLYRFEELVLKFIRRTVSLYDRNKIRTIMIETRNALVKLSKIKSEQQTLSYFDFISWLDSKLENRRFTDLVKEKVRERLKLVAE
ncbi:MAG TPA: hypothetical protein VK783_09165 [Bacteroidia bacterium]|jgi:hypothetical protein|nr:hypothetical protein [Bacteroidia bacterium]